MPPASYWTFNREWNDLNDNACLGGITVTTDCASGDAKGAGAVTTRASTFGELSARLMKNVCCFSTAVTISPNHYPRPWLTAGPYKTGAEDGAFAATHYIGAGISGDSGKAGVEWSMTHPTFVANVQAEPDCRGVPMSGTASVAACGPADVGLRFKYDPLRSGLLDYAIGTRYKTACGKALVGILNAKNQVSATVAGSTEFALGSHAVPTRYAVNISDNGSSAGAAVGISTPCGRSVCAVVKALPKVEATIGLVMPVSDAWKVAFSVSPTKFASGATGYLGMQLIGL
jgi:hypothetical protein